jgi:hypothetical protein
MVRQGIINGRLQLRTMQDVVTQDHGRLLRWVRLVHYIRQGLSFPSSRSTIPKRPCYRSIPFVRLLAVAIIGPHLERRGESS